MEFNRSDLSNEALIDIYKHLLLPRMIEEKMLVLLRQGKISKWFSGIGQEAIAVGSTLALQDDEWIMPMHRNLGVFTSRQMPLHKLFMQWQGNQEGYSKGRERSFHFGNKEHEIEPSSIMCIDSVFLRQSQNCSNDFSDPDFEIVFPNNNGIEIVTV